MFPHERSLVKQYANRPFAIIGVNSDADLDDLKEKNKAANITWRSFWAGGGKGAKIPTDWNIRGWPTIFVIDHEGVIRYKNVRGEALDKAIAELVAKAEAAQKKN